VLILLPPSEGKAEARRGAPLDLDALSFPGLRGARERVLDALAAAAAAPDPCRVLGLPATLAPQVARNARLCQAPAHAAERVYTGVLYDALDLRGLPAGARRRSRESVVIVSALFGAVRPGDRIPAYRLAMDVDLPGVGPLAAVWREALAPELAAAAGGGVVVDCRSATYAAAWRPPRPIAERTVGVRVLREHAGERSVVSHMAKQTRGFVARELLLAGRRVRRPQDIAAALAGAFETELQAPSRAGAGWTLDVIVRAG